MIRVELPYNYGTFVKVKDKDGSILYCGTVTAYTVTDDGWLVWVAGYKKSCCGEFRPEEVEPMKEFEVKDLLRQTDSF